MTLVPPDRIGWEVVGGMEHGARTQRALYLLIIAVGCESCWRKLLRSGLVRAVLNDMVTG